MCVCVCVCVCVGGGERVCFCGLQVPCARHAACNNALSESVVYLTTCISSIGLATILACLTHNRYTLLYLNYSYIGFLNQISLHSVTLYHKLNLYVSLQNPCRKLFQLPPNTNV